MRDVGRPTGTYSITIKDGSVHALLMALGKSGLTAPELWNGTDASSVILTSKVGLCLMIRKVWPN